MSVFDPGPQILSDYVADVNRYLVSINAANTTRIALISAPNDLGAMLDVFNRTILAINSALGLSIALMQGPQDAATFLAQLNTLAIGQTFPAYTYNLKRSNTASFRAVYKAGARNALLAFMGDSTMRGTDETAVPYNAQFGNSMPMKLAVLLNALGITAGANNLFGSGTTTIADLVLRDGRFAYTGAATFGGVQTQGGSDFNFPTAASSISFTPQGNVDTFENYWRDAATGRNFNWQVDGGSTTAINSSNVAQMAKTVAAAGAVGAHTITLNWVAGACDIFGWNAYDSTRKEISCLNWGVNGATCATMVGNIGAPNGGRLQFITSFPPDMVIGELGVVNSWRNSISVASAKADMTTCVQAVKAAGSNFILLTPPYDGGSTGFTSNQDAYIQAMYQIADSENVPLIDIRRPWISSANQVALGLVGDNIHPTIAVGYPNEAAFISNVVKWIVT